MCSEYLFEMCLIALHMLLQATLKQHLFHVFEMCLVAQHMIIQATLKQHVTQVLV